MLYAIDDHGVRIEAIPNSRAKCPSCGCDVIAKCGNIMIWHWAHINQECPFSTERETEWHRNHKERYPENMREIVVGEHRADIKTQSMVVEFQHSNISGDEITKREVEYCWFNVDNYDFTPTDMVWVIDAKPFFDNFVIYNKGDYCTFRWKWPRKSWCSSQSPKVLDFGNGEYFEIKKLNFDRYCGGWGRWISAVELYLRTMYGWDSIDKENQREKFFNSVSQKFVAEVAK